MPLLHDLALGFGLASTPPNLSCGFFGLLLGLVVGVLPGIGPVTAIALLLPAVHALGALPALILLAGVCCGARQGGSIAVILAQSPGERAPRAVARSDGRAMVRHGRAGAALTASVGGSFFAGVIGVAMVVACMAIVAPLGRLDLDFGPAERVGLIVLALTGAVVLAAGSLVKSMAMLVLGLLLAQIDTGPAVAGARYRVELAGFEDVPAVVVLTVGLFAFGPVIARLAGQREPPGRVPRAPGRRWPSGRDLLGASAAVVRGGPLGAVLGLLPGRTPRLAASASCAVEARVAGRPGDPPLGMGNIRGVAGPDGAAQAAGRSAFAPTLLLGLPPDASMALIVAAMTLEGLTPGPALLAIHGPLVWGLIASMVLGQAMLTVLALPLVRVWTRLSALPLHRLVPTILLTGCVGVLTLRDNPVDLYLTAFFAALGYIFHKLGCNVSPLLLGFLLGPGLEADLRGALLASGGDWSDFLTRPLAAGLLATALMLVVAAMMPTIGKWREAVFLDD